MNIYVNKSMCKFTIVLLFFQGCTRSSFDGIVEVLQITRINSASVRKIPNKHHVDTIQLDLLQEALGALEPYKEITDKDRWGQLWNAPKKPKYEIGIHAAGEFVSIWVIAETDNKLFFSINIKGEQKYYSGGDAKKFLEKIDQSLRE